MWWGTSSGEGVTDSSHSLICCSKSFGYGYDVVTNEYVDMFEAGVIDPTKVVVTALSDASSVASLMCTTEAAVVKSSGKSASSSIENRRGMQPDQLFD